MLVVISPYKVVSMGFDLVWIETQPGIDHQIIRASVRLSEPFHNTVLGNTDDFFLACVGKPVICIGLQVGSPICEFGVRVIREN